MEVYHIINLVCRYIDTILKYYQSTHYGYGQEAANLEEVPFHIGYQDADETCFTRDSPDETGLIRLYDQVFLNRVLLEPGNNRRLEVKIVFHYPGQLIGQINSPAHQFFLEEMQTYTKLTHDSSATRMMQMNTTIQPHSVFFIN